MNLVAKQIYSFAKVGFLGLGNMGMPMAANLAKNGHEVFGFDVDTSKKSVAESSSVKFFTDMREVVKASEVFVAMLPNSEFSKSVCESDNGIFNNAKSGSLIIDCSTISPMVAE